MSVRSLTSESQVTFQDTQLSAINETWKRDTSWLPMPTVSPSEEKFVGLVAVYRTIPNYIALRAAGSYTVNWGDGNTENVAAGVVAYHSYDFNNATLADTDGPVTFQQSGNLVLRNNHGYVNGDIVSFDFLAGGMANGLLACKSYFVISATTNSFQISNTNGGATVAWTGNGTGKLLTYKQAIITVTPQSGQQLVTLSLHHKHTSVGASTGVSQFLDIIISGPNMTTLGLGALGDGTTTSAVIFPLAERVNILSCKSQKNVCLFQGFYSLEKIENLNFNGPVITKTVTAAGLSATINCANHGFQQNDVIVFENSTSSTVNSWSAYFVATALQNSFTIKSSIAGAEITYVAAGTATATSGGWFDFMFGQCRSLRVIKDLTIPSAVVMNSIFRSPDWNTTSSITCFDVASLPEVRLMKNLFTSCTTVRRWTNAANSLPKLAATGLYDTCYQTTNLEEVYLPDLPKCTSLSYMFKDCTNLKVIVIGNLQNCTDLQYFAYGALRLRHLSLGNLRNCTNLNLAFQNCYNLEEVNLDCGAVSLSTFVFYNCYNLKKVYLRMLSGQLSFSNMFENAYRLESVIIGSTSFSPGTNLEGLFKNCKSLKYVSMDTTNVSNMSLLFDGCSTLVNAPELNMGQVTTASYMFRNCSYLTNVPLYNTSALTQPNSMFESCTSLRTIPPFNLTACSNIDYMFYTCVSLEKVPPLNTAALTSVSGAFVGCHSLKEVSIINTSAVSNFSNCFQNCYALQRVYIGSTASGTNFNGMFDNCTSLVSGPYIRAYNSSDGSYSQTINMFNGCKSLVAANVSGSKTDIGFANCNMSGQALNDMYGLLGTALGGAPRFVTVTGNYGTASHTPSIATAKGWTVTG